MLVLKNEQVVAFHELISYCNSNNIVRGLMKRISLIVLLIISYSSAVWCAPENVCSVQDKDKIVEAIEASDPDMLRAHIIPGCLIRLEDKKRYVDLAQKITNRTYAELNKFGISQLFTCSKGLFYLGLGFFCGLDMALIAKDHTGPIITLFDTLSLGTRETSKTDVDARIVYADWSARKEVRLGLLGAIGLYFSAKGLGLFHDVLTKRNRLTAHNNALTVEAIIQRLPAFDNGCAIPGAAS